MPCVLVIVESLAMVYSLPSLERYWEVGVLSHSQEHLPWKLEKQNISALRFFSHLERNNIIIALGLIASDSVVSRYSFVLLSHVHNC